jgi:NitT/TauT family transport system ATP-binding protein
MSTMSPNGEPGAGLIEVRHLGQRFVTPDHGDVIALADINLTVQPGEFVCLLGPSGCGKSTLLNALAGFVQPTSGRILVGGAPVGPPGPDRGMVFQEYALFPWMTVADNVGFGLTLRHLPKPEVQRQVAELLAMLGLSDFAGRFPKDLSGGMRQRVAIARVLALQSPILLMDEPFGALDALTRRTLQDELLQLWQRWQRTVVFVTHSIEEALYLADRIVVMSFRPGTIKRDLHVDLPRPRDEASARFNALKRELGELVMAEQRRHVADEQGGLQTAEAPRA